MSALFVVSANNPLLLNDLPQGKADVLLTEDAVCLLLTPLPAIDELKSRHALFVLEPDLVARGIPLPEGISAVDYAGMVELTEIHSPVICWS